MVTLRMRSFDGFRRLPFLLTVLAPLTLVGASAAGQPAPAGFSPSQLKLKGIIEARYRAYAIQDGILFVPRTAVATVESIEVRQSTIGVNGTIVTGSELRQRLGADADAVIELSYLEPPARRALLFGTTAPPTAPPPTPEMAPEPAPQAPPEPAPIERARRRTDARIRVGGSVRVERDEVVNGAVVAVLGSATIDGEVRDDVVVVAGDVQLGPDANVHGDVTVVGGKLDVDRKARVGGQLNEIGFDSPRIRFRPFERWGWPIHPFRSWWSSPVFNLFAVSLRMLLFGLLSLILVVAAPGPLGRIERRVTAEPWKSGLVGLVAQLLFVPLLVLTVVILAVSIIGIPLLLLVPFALLALLFALLIGFAGVATRAGRWAEERFGLAPRTRAVALVTGLIAIWALSLVGHLVALGGWAVWGLAAIFSAAGFLVEYLAWTVGFGAALLTRFGTRPSGGDPAVPAEPHFEPPPPVDPLLVDVDLK